MSTNRSRREHHVVACLGGSRTRLERRPIPEPGEGELLLRLRLVGLCGTDLFKLDTGAATAGQVLGHELVGEVVEAGTGVGEFAIGDRIAVPHHVPCGDCALCRRGSHTLCATFRENLLLPGGFADHVLVDTRAREHAAHRLPARLSDEAAVFLEPAACVLRGVHRSGIEAGGVAVVIGGGSMGLLHLLVLRAAVPRVRVLISEPVARRREIALSLGAEAASEPGAPTRCTVSDLSGGVGADAVFDTVGGAGPLEAALGASREGGTVVLFAHAGEGERAGFDLNSVFKFERRIVGTYSGALAEQEQVFDLLADGRLDPAPLATHRLPLERFDEGVALARAGEALKVLFTPAGGP